MKKLALVVTITLLLVSGYFGVSNGTREFGQAQTTLQRSVSCAVILYGFLGFVGALLLMRRHSWSVVVIAGWAISAAYAASVATFAYSDPTFAQPGTLAAVLSAGAATLLIGAFVVWTARRTVRESATPADRGITAGSR